MGLFSFFGKNKTKATAEEEPAAPKPETSEERVSFTSFVLLEDAAWDKDSLLATLKEQWGIEAEPAKDENPPEGMDPLVFNCGDMLVAYSLMPAPIPTDEAVHAAEINYLWNNGVEQVKRTKAHILIYVSGPVGEKLETGELLVKAVASACEQKGVLGVYTGAVTYQPAYYIDFAGMMRDGMFPLYNLVWCGMYRGEEGMCAYTRGMDKFGYDEIEVLNSAASPQELNEFVMDIAGYVITEGVVLRDGETIGFTAEQKLPITKSPGVALDQETLKIRF